MFLKYFKKGSNGQIILDKVSGQKYVVTGVYENGLEAIPTNEEGSEAENEKSIRVTEENAIVYRLLKDPNPKDAPDVNGYSLRNGAIIAPDGESIPLGDINAVDILGSVRGKLILLVTEDDMRGVRIYDVNKDRFGETVTIFNTPKTLYADEDIVILSSNDLVQTEEKDEENEETGEVTVVNDFTKTRILYITSRRISFSDNPFLLKDNVLILDGKTKTIIVGTQDVLTDGSIVDTYNTAVIRHNFGMEMIPGADYVKGAVSRDGSIVLIAANGVYVKDTGIFIKVDTSALMEGNYIYLVDTVVNDTTTTFYLTNDKRQVKKLVTRQTSDRGVVASVE